MLDDSKRTYIREITKAEMEKILNAWRGILYRDTEKKWGGLFICTIERKGFHPIHKYRYIAIDDSDGNAHVEEFKTHEAAVKWLIKCKGPKLCRM